MTLFIKKLRNECHRDSTRKGYYNIWKNFNQFCIKLDHNLNNWEDRLTLYVGFLIQNDRELLIICSYVSAIRALHATERIELNENKYLLACLTKACKLKNDVVYMYWALNL